MKTGISFNGDSEGYVEKGTRFQSLLKSLPDEPPTNFPVGPPQRVMTWRRGHLPGTLRDG